MLNELYDLAQCLEDAHVALASWHQHFKPCPVSSATFMAKVDANCRVAELQPIRDKQRIASVRKWEVENGVSFPALNVPPLYEPTGEGAKGGALKLRKSLVSKVPPEASEIRREIATLVGASKSLWANREASRINKCLTTHASALGLRLGPVPPEYRAIEELIARSSRLSADLVHKQLTELVTASIAQSPAMASELFDLLFFHTGKTAKKVSLILDLCDWAQFAYPASHEAVQSWINSRLHSPAISQSSTIATSESADIDAYANAAGGISHAFPAARLPILGNVILRAMSSESPCQKRYGVADSESCRVGQVSRQRMKNSLEWIGHPERRQRTWSDVSSLNGAATVLFAYPSKQSGHIPELAGLIVGLDSEEDPDGSRFEACAGHVTQALQGIATESSAEVRVFVLAKPDGFRTKVVHSERYSVDRLLRSAENWQHSARNIPYIRIRRFGPEKGDKPYSADPLTPFPAEIVGCLNTIWERAGTHPVQVRDFNIRDAIGLLLEIGPRLRTIALRSMQRLVVGLGGLALALGQAHHQGRVHPFGKKYAKQPRLVPSVLGLLLAKLGREKGEYMKGPPFLVGRLLSLADQLHVQYCRTVRNGQIPPQLVGNALMATAQEQPTKALAMLCQRILPYQAWAQTVQGGDEVRLAKYFLAELGRICAELKNLKLPTRCDDTDRAEMLLGYLTWSERSTTDDPPNSDNPQGE